jgi:hypothetical protein
MFLALRVDYVDTAPPNPIDHHPPQAPEKILSYKLY